jgi:hypothetical protein
MEESPRLLGSGVWFLAVKYVDRIRAGWVGCLAVLYFLGGQDPSRGGIWFLAVGYVGRVRAVWVGYLAVGCMGRVRAGWW